jgi:GDPmannose 4,6-dehydratase
VKKPLSSFTIRIKLYGYWILQSAKHNIFASNGIFLTKSPRRGETFVSRKITRAASRIVAGLQKELTLGNLNAKRDWGYAPEYCEGMWRILQHKEADDFVLRPVKRKQSVIPELTFRNLGIELAEGKGK